MVIIRFIRSLPGEHSERGQRAQGLVEFSLVLPVLLLLMMGMVEFARLMAIYTGVSISSREAARYGAGVGLTERIPTASYTPPYRDCAGIIAAAQRLSILTPLQTITIQYDSGPGTTPRSPCPQNVALGDRVIVSVTATYQPLMLPLVHLPPIPLASTTRRTVVRDVWVGY